MEYLIYIVFGIVVVGLLSLWLWVMRIVARTTTLLDDATTEIEGIAQEVKLVAKEFIEVTNDLEQAKYEECASSKKHSSSNSNDK